MLQNALLFLIRAYQSWVSPWLGQNCRFIPTCSIYCYQAIELYGPWKGSVKGLLRLLRCHPLHPGGYDPVVSETSDRRFS
ncbi:MAG: membrane protein insertion efficiency factor YidD [Syntrophobacteraceae bacterium CG2_30_61_12]|nr:MAG: membrane protein insertion efficiency factor YidD [Syntrophobacteraceae bacterium CG2_30_61_12]PIU32817.1 MAG: membrane protein insertion efficiency factor YidD [Syntrophobacteraceae bacterium CG07_land_8_20_14_0_80_61_8]